MKILMFNHLPAPYLVEFLNQIGKDIELTVIFKDATSFEREDSWLNYQYKSFKADYLPKSLFKKISFMFHYMMGDYDLFWNADYSKFECIFFTFWYKLRKKIVLMHADGGIPIPRNIDPLIRFVMKQAHFFASSGIECDKYYQYYHINPQKIFHYRFTSQTREDLLKNQCYIEQRNQYRKELGISNEIVLFSVGQQIPRKGYDLLVQAMKDVPKSVKLFIAGGNPEPHVQQIIDKFDLSNIFFVGFKNKDELSKYYAASDIFVLPTRYDIWGLVINEAMSFSLPIISTEKCAAAVQFVNEFKNGLIVPIDDIESLASAINELIENSKLRASYAELSFESIQEYTIENMVSDYISIFNEIKRRVNYEDSSN
ncbi:MAG: glycosyltransferase family 4 protein [Anaerorhabdus sp.]